MYAGLEKVCFPSKFAGSGFVHVYLPMDKSRSVSNNYIVDNYGFCGWECPEQVCEYESDELIEKWTGGIDYVHKTIWRLYAKSNRQPYGRLDGVCSQTEKY